MIKQFNGEEKRYINRPSIKSSTTTPIFPNDQEARQTPNALCVANNTIEFFPRKQIARLKKINFVFIVQSINREMKTTEKAPTIASTVKSKGLEY